LKSGKLQQSAELVIEFLEGQLEENIGHDGHQFLPVIGTLGLFIAISNILGLVPGLGSPNQKPLCSGRLCRIHFYYYNFAGIRNTVW
jgi:F-type H+-transporting ATPase subunit a